MPKASRRRTKLPPQTMMQQWNRNLREGHTGHEDYRHATGTDNGGTGQTQGQPRSVDTDGVSAVRFFGDAFRSNCESSSGHATDIALDIFHLFSIYEGHSLSHIILCLDCVYGYCTDNSTKSRRSSVTASLRLLSVRSSATSRRSCAP